MNRQHLDPRYAPALVAVGVFTLGAANADDYARYEHRTEAQGADRPSGDVADEMRDAQQQLREATKVVQKMKQDPKLTALLQRAEGVFIAPDYGKGAAIIGARGGEGVLLVGSGEDWSSKPGYCAMSCRTAWRPHANCRHPTMTQNEPGAHSDEY